MPWACWRIPKTNLLHGDFGWSLNWANIVSWHHARLQVIFLAEFILTNKSGSSIAHSVYLDCVLPYFSHSYLKLLLGIYQPINNMKLSLILIAGIGVHACERDLKFRNHQRHLKRAETNATFPPILDENERILINSFDSTSISTWSYYYSMSDLDRVTQTNHE